MAREKGIDVLRNPSLNKATAFTQKERSSLQLVGLLPEVVETEEIQLKRVMHQLGHKNTDYDRYIFLMNLLDHNEGLFYKTIMSDPKRFLPIIYDPTIGDACLKFDSSFRQPRGMYLSLQHKGKLKKILVNWPEKDIRFICVTDGGRILGLGDLGANGMAIPIGKLQLYTAAAGVPPKHLLPLFLDVGTNNEELLQSPLYLGLRRARPSQKALYDFVDEFVDSVQAVFPKCCIHFEDWTGVDAIQLLDRYRDKVSCYNDDIQGTASIALAGLINAVKIKKSKLSEEKILFLGAGSAGIGIANLIVSEMTGEGLSEDKARKQIALYDIKGWISKDRNDLFPFQKPFAHDLAKVKDFAEAVQKWKPTAIIGVSTVGGAFNRRVIEALSAFNKRPIIFALSNPTQHAECTAEDAYHWSKGKALFAAGVQFQPVHINNRVFFPGQANNFYIFPAIGMAVFATEAKRVTDSMFIEAAKAVASEVSDQQLDKGLLYPPQEHILDTEVRVAARVAKEIFSLKLARVKKPPHLEKWIRSKVYQP